MRVGGSTLTFSFVPEPVGWYGKSHLSPFVYFGDFDRSTGFLGLFNWVGVVKQTPVHDGGRVSRIHPRRVRFAVDAPSGGMIDAACFRVC